MSEAITMRTSKLDIAELVVPGADRKYGRASLICVCGDNVEVIHLRPPHDTVVVGRCHPADVYVSHPTLSRQHARFTWKSGRMMVEDLNSLNGTWVSGRRVTQKELRSGDQVKLGSLRITVSIVPATQDTSGGADHEDDDFIVSSARMRQLYDLVDRLSQTDVSVLILGETGTGKEHVAHALHNRGPRSSAPFKVINCGAIPEALTESILFGHERGAFTGAGQRRAGVFEEACGGTLFLDEVGELPIAAQVKLLRVLETKSVMRLGSSEEIPVQVRVVAATHCDVEQMVRERSFRADLLYRLNAFTLEIPPLRERKEEIPPLARLFANRAAKEFGRGECILESAALAALQRYSWPGNIRQLRNVMERAALLCADGRITSRDLPAQVTTPESDATLLADEAQRHSVMIAADADPEDAPFREQIRALEIQLISTALDRSGGNHRAAAKLLRMPRRTLAYKVQAYGLSPGVPDDQDQPPRPG